MYFRFKKIYFQYEKHEIQYEFPYVYNIQLISIPFSILFVDVKTAFNHSESDKTTYDK